MASEGTRLRLNTPPTLRHPLVCLLLLLLHPGSPSVFPTFGFRSFPTLDAIIESPSRAAQVEVVKMIQVFRVFHVFQWVSVGTPAAFGLWDGSGWLIPPVCHDSYDAGSKIESWLIHMSHSSTRRFPRLFPVRVCKSEAVLFRPQSRARRSSFSCSPRREGPRQKCRIPGEFQNAMSGICIGLLLLTKTCRP